MLNVSWKEYIIAVLIITALYYLFVVLRYFLPEVKALLNGRKNGGIAVEDEEEFILNPFEPQQESPDEYAEEEDSEYVVVEELLLRLKEVISIAADHGLDRKQLKGTIKSLLAEYPSIESPIMRAGIAEQIVTDCKSLGSASLDAREVDGLWG